MTTQKKITIVKKLTEKLERAKAFFLADYRGLTHQQLEGLRSILKKTGAELVIVKNKLFSRSLEQSKIDKKHLDGLKNSLKNPTAAFFAYKDAIVSIKELYKFVKSADLPKIKSGFFEARVIGAEEFNSLATLPTQEVLLTILAARLNAPIYGLHYALMWNLQRLVVTLNNIKYQKSRQREGSPKAANSKYT